MSKKRKKHKNEQETMPQSIGTPIDHILDFFGLKNVDIFFDKMFDYAHKHFQRFGAIVAAVVTVCVWIFRTIKYSYQSGVFSVYNIDNCYIQIDDSLLLQIISSVAIIVFYFIVNCFYLRIATRPDNSKFNIKRRFKLLCYVLVQTMVIFGLVLLGADVSLYSLVEELKGYDNIEAFATIFVFVISFLLISLTVNFIGIVESKSIQAGDGDKQKDYKQSSVFTATSKQKLMYGSTILVSISVMIIFAYFLGVINARQNVSFKMIESPVEYSTTEEKNYVFSIHEENYSCILYPIIYENEDIYIISRLHFSDNRISVDNQYQKVIEKKGVETYLVDNINVFKEGNYFN